MVTFGGQTESEAEFAIWDQPRLGITFLSFAIAVGIVGILFFKIPNIFLRRKNWDQLKLWIAFPPVTISSCNRLQKINEIYLKNLEKKQNRKNIFGFGCEGNVSACGEQSLNTSMDQKYWSQILVNVYRQSRTSVEQLFWANKWFYNDQLRARKCNWRPRKKGKSQPWSHWHNIFFLFKYLQISFYQILSIFLSVF